MREVVKYHKCDGLRNGNKITCSEHNSVITFTTYCEFVTNKYLSVTIFCYITSSTCHKVLFIFYFKHVMSCYIYFLSEPKAWKQYASFYPRTKTMRPFCFKYHNAYHRRTIQLKPPLQSFFSFILCSGHSIKQSQIHMDRQTREARLSVHIYA